MNQLEYRVSCSSDFLGCSPKLHPFGHSCADLTENATFLLWHVRALGPLQERSGNHMVAAIFVVLPSLGNSRLILPPSCQDQR
jgi:hypothetical protein